ncbi:dimethyl sulfoxide reductase subunit A [Escherichia albertii]|uniref:Dimethyl sulfoxide reductase subunit A n=1 Tax=Escherichia albertii TaxID=208962 RepID=A0ABX5HKG9_ESCAL|nr:molybdopterin dinucleotide binding domain-containing protein [Escherichia albertii]PSY42974.1 dimethyl sulfoxide reductase subunit A [Escherichia albertii]
MSKNESQVGISRRTLVKSTAIGSLALAAGGFSLPFTMRNAAAAVQQASEKVVWGACSVNCGSRCPLRLHVKDNEVIWVETDNTGKDEYGNHQVRACLRGRYADILLPDLMTVEQEDIIPNDSAGNMGYLIFFQPATRAKFERKPIYWIMSEVAKRLGPDVYQKFTEGRTQEQWLQYLYAKMVAKDPTLPSYDELKKMGIYKRKDPNGHFVAYKAFRDDPEANPLKTPSGKIEIYSSQLAEIARTWELEKDEVISPLPIYASTFEGWDSPERSAFPLQLFGFHYKSRTHSSYGNIDVLQSACRQEVWINPVDAQKRGIANGDMVRVFNHRGEVRLPAKVTPRIIPGVSAMGQGAWHEANMSGDKIDHGGCVNTLTTLRPSPLAKGNPQHTNLVEIEKI